MIPKEIQDLIDSIVLEEDDQDWLVEEDPDWLVAIWPLVLAKVGKGIKDSNWKLWVKAWQDAIQGAFNMGTVGDTVGTVAPALVGSDAAIKYFLEHGMELVKTLSTTDIQILKGQMIENWGKGEDAFKDAFEDQYKGPARLDKIYRTEYVRAQNEGIVVRAKAAGHKYKMWRCPNDERSCPECSAMDYEVVPIGEMFSGGVMTPGLHPNCRCVLISVADEDSEVFSEDVEPIIA